jgi:aspartyl protease
VWQAIKEESEQTLGKLKENITKLQMASTEEENVKQLDIQVKVGNETITAIVDCGADVDYVNEEWCKKKGFPVTETGDGLMRGFDGRQTRAKIHRNQIQVRRNVYAAEVPNSQRNRQ